MLTWLLISSGWDLSVFFVLLRSHLHAFITTEPSWQVAQQDFTPKGPEAIFRPFLRFGQAIVKAIFIKKIHEFSHEHVV
jgi:hypothetical protein